MKKMIFSVPERLAKRIDAILEEDGFVNRPDFFRFLAMSYLDRRTVSEGISKNCRGI